MPRAMSNPVGKSLPPSARSEIKQPERPAAPRAEPARDFRRALGARRERSLPASFVPSATRELRGAPPTHRAHAEGDERFHARERPIGEPLRERDADRDHEPSDVPIALVAEPDLAPFRVNPALQPTRPATPEPMRTDQLASLVTAELVESLRVGRFGRDGHAISMRVRTPNGVVGVELRQEDGALAMSLDGGTPAELEALSARVQRALRDRGIELDCAH